MKFRVGGPACLIRIAALLTEQNSKLGKANAQDTRGQLGRCPEQDLGLVPSRVRISTVVEADDEADGCEDRGAGHV